MSLLIAFSGQGNQHGEMFNVLASDKFGKTWLSDASKLINIDLFDALAVEKACADVVDTQLLLVILSEGAFYALEKQIQLSPPFLCGYSLGEVSAFCASARLDLAESLDLVRNRALMMQEAVKGKSTGLIVLKGRISLAMASELCEKHGCYLAIVNADDHYIIGGEEKALLSLLQEAKERSVLKAERLAVKLASHTPLLSEASGKFLNYLQRFKDQRMRFPILNALTLERVDDTELMLSLLAHELSQTLHWNKVMSIAKEYGISSFLELGPRAALKNMVPSLLAYNLEGFASFAGLVNVVQRL
ncbi:Malonyl CoA-acyl carrier protein transacylase [Legionella massiliensis]|uniref:Malonyl CoA-acyl carrier protein transacylase n=1 Tax=Legionella massiliensis TaxID=1034943 RepID=A0A078KX38_9GAMM|nr:acyltransferase domain-containing protein [Legionella massiliensis]CDZ77526.1 Malonyl CoA-acyl carrier protein transacylase [Legionella massiliensis]CEE13264.1 Malonyl CoA-acyl carrier protein transacylase [Legionella massiliensis]